MLKNKILLLLYLGIISFANDKLEIKFEFNGGTGVMPVKVSRNIRENNEIVHDLDNYGKKYNLGLDIEAYKKMEVVKDLNFDIGLGLNGGYFKVTDVKERKGYITEARNTLVKFKQRLEEIKNDPSQKEEAKDLEVSIKNITNNIDELYFDGVYINPFVTTKIEKKLDNFNVYIGAKAGINTYFSDYFSKTHKNTNGSTYKYPMQLHLDAKGFLGVGYKDIVFIQGELSYPNNFGGAIGTRINY
ncbi:hypothetical protein [Pseudostreptobacillus sp.]